MYSYATEQRQQVVGGIQIPSQLISDHKRKISFLKVLL